MKKVILFVIVVLSVVFLYSCENNVPAEIIILNDEGQEEILKITTTENKEELTTLISELKNAKLNPVNWMGASIELSSKIEGKMVIGEEDVTKVDVNYDIHLDGIVNLKKYLLSGNYSLEGYTKTESLNLSMKSKQKVLGNMANDDENLYLDYSFELEGIKGKAKKKLDITSFTEEYKPQIISSLDILKYYNPLTLFPEIESYITAVSETKKDSFTIKLSLPVGNKWIDCYLELNCQYLLPVQIKMNLDDILIEELEKEYLDKYVGQPIHVEDASFTLEVNIEYGNYSVKELSIEEKSLYTYF